MEQEGGVDAQGLVIGLGTVVVLLVFVYGTILSDTVLGVDTTTVAAWVFAVTFALVALLHLSVSNYNLAFGHVGAAGGWLFVLLGSTGLQILIGLVLLGLSGTYIVMITLRQRDPSSTPDSAIADEQ